MQLSPHLETLPEDNLSKATDCQCNSDVYHQALSYTDQLALANLLCGRSGSIDEAKAKAKILTTALHSEVIIETRDNAFFVYLLDNDYLCLDQAAKEESLELEEFDPGEEDLFTSWWNERMA